MKNNGMFLFAVPLAVMLALTPCAYAGSPRISPSRAIRSIGMPSPGSIARSSGRSNPWKDIGRGVRSSRASNPIRNGIGAPRSANPIRTPRYAGGLPGLSRGSDRSSQRGPGGANYGDLLNLFQGMGEQLYRAQGYAHGRPSYREEDAMAKAYRDVGIMNALVGLTGVLISASQNANYGTVAHGPRHTPAPAPAAYAPSGRWERQAVVLQPQQQEQSRVWVPETYDAHTGQKVSGGYYEVRTRITPEVVQYHDVWVTP